MPSSLVLMALAALAALAAANSALLRAVPQTEGQLDALHHHLRQLPKVSVWLDATQPGMPVDLQGPVSALQGLQEALQDLEWQHLAIPPAPQGRSGEEVGDKGPNYPAYRDDLDEVYGWLADAAQVHSEAEELHLEGTTTEGRNITGLHLRDPSSAPNTMPVVIVEAGSDPRDWLTPEVAIGLIDAYLNPADPDDTFQRVARNFEWFVLPVANPDGFTYAHGFKGGAGTVAWRKTRCKYWYYCFGVNLQRNFPYIGTGSSPGQGHCDQWCGPEYGGPFPGSEPETSALQQLVELVLRGQQRSVLYLSLQGYGRRLQYPPGMLELQRLLERVAEQEPLGYTALPMEKPEGTSVLWASQMGVRFPLQLAVGDAVYSPPENISQVANETRLMVALLLDAVLDLTSRPADE